MLQKIHKSHMSKISKKHGNAMVAHLSTVNADQPLCNAGLPKSASWVREGDESYKPDRDCNNCSSLARRAGLR